MGANLAGFCLFFLPPVLSQWVTLNESWECGSLRLQPASERLRLLLPPPSSITWLVLSWLSVLLTAWPPGGSPAKCHITSGLGFARVWPSIIFTPTSTPIPTWHYLKKRTICLFLSIYSSLCFCSVGWEDLLANIKQYTAIILHTASTGRLSIFVMRLETRTCTAAYKHSYHTG